MKRTWLKRGKPPRRLSPMPPRKRPMRQRSTKKARVVRDSRPVVAEVMERDGGCVLRDRTDEWGPCDGPLDPHHILRQSQGGLWLPEHLLTVCRLHHDWIGDYPEAATACGLSASSTEELHYAWHRRQDRGIGLGTYAPLHAMYRDDTGSVPGWWLAAAVTLVAAACGGLLALGGWVHDVLPAPGNSGQVCEQRTDCESHTGGEAGP